MSAEGRGVSVEMRQRKHVKTIILSDVSWENVLFEGNLGQLVELSMVDHSVLEVRGANGVLRVDLTLKELEELSSRIRSSEASSSKSEEQKKNRQKER